MIAGLTLVVSLAGATAVLALQPGAPAEESPEAVFATDAPHPSSKSTRAATKSIARWPVEPETALAVLEASRPAPVTAFGDRPFALSRDEASEPAATQPPPAATPAQPAATAAPPPAPPLVVDGDELYAILQSVFPEDPDRAYAIVMCESSGNARAVSPAGYYGMWQFDIGTWRSVGGTGLPSNASVQEQMKRARMLYDARGWSPWGC